MTHDDREGAALKGAPWPACWGWMENPREERRESVWVLEEKTTVHVGVWGCQKSLCKKSTYLPRYAGAKGQRTERCWDIQKSLVVRSLRGAFRKCPQSKEPLQLERTLTVRQEIPQRQLQITEKDAYPVTFLSVNVFTGLFTCSRHSCVRSWLNSYHEGRVWRSHNAVSWVYTQTINS